MWCQEKGAHFFGAGGGGGGGGGGPLVYVDQSGCQRQQQLLEATSAREHSCHLLGMSVCSPDVGGIVAQSHHIAGFLKANPGLEPAAINFFYSY